MRIYLDVCCLNRPFDDLRQPRVRIEAGAINMILRQVAAGTHSMISSEAVQYEVARNNNPVTRRGIGIFASFANEIVQVTDPIRARQAVLMGLGFTPLDALHLSCAEDCGADVFLTVDDRLLKLAVRSAGLRIAVDNPVFWLERTI